MGVMKQAKPKILPTKINSLRMGRGCLECTVVVVMTGAPPPPSISRNISDPMKSCARARFLVQKGEASMHIPYDLCIGTKRLGTFHRPCAFSSEAFAHVYQLVQTGRRLWHKFFVRAHDYWPTYPNKIDQSESF